jgi:tetratricopeptide (TPR) repeat protein
MIGPRFVNRDNHIDWCQTWATTPETTRGPFRVSIIGGSGMGKTTLAARIGETVLQSSFPRTLFVPVYGDSPQTTSTAHDLAGWALTRLGVPQQEMPTDATRLIPALLWALEQRQTLLVFDNVRNLAQVLPFLESAPALSGIMVTSEQDLGLRRFDFETRALEVFGPDHGAILIRDVAGSAVADTAPERLAAVGSLCGGVPALLTAAAALLRDGWSVEDLLTLLTEGGALVELQHDGQPVADRVFGACYTGLDSVDQHAYRALAMIPGHDLTAAKAAAVLRTTESKARRSINQLVRMGLAESRDGRYRLYTLARQHASGLHRDIENTGDTDEFISTAEIIHRSIRWDLQLAVSLVPAISGRRLRSRALAEYCDTVAPAYSGPDSTACAAAELDVEWLNLIAAAKCAIEARDELAAVLLPMVLWPYGYRYLRLDGLLGIGHELVAIMDDPDRAWPIFDDPAIRWQVLFDLAGLYEKSGRPGDMDTYLDLAYRAGFPAGDASLMEWRGFAYERRDDPAQALASFQVAITLIPRMNDPVQQARATALLHMHCSRALRELGRLDEARAETTTAIVGFGDDPADTFNVALCREQLGLIALDTAHPDQARAEFTLAVDAFLANHNNTEAARVLHRLADLADTTGDRAQAHSHHTRAAELETGR